VQNKSFDEGYFPVQSKVRKYDLRKTNNLILAVKPEHLMGVNVSHQDLFFIL